MGARIGRQGGWVGLIVILLALAIVAWLAKDALKQYGLLSGAPKAEEPTGLQRSPTPAAVSDYSGAAHRRRFRHRSSGRAASRRLSEGALKPRRGRRTTPRDDRCAGSAQARVARRAGAAEEAKPPFRNRSRDRDASRVRGGRRPLSLHDPARLDDRVRWQCQPGDEAHRARRRYLDRPPAGNGERRPGARKAGTLTRGLRLRERAPRPPARIGATLIRPAP